MEIYKYNNKEDFIKKVFYDILEELNIKVIQYPEFANEVKQIKEETKNLESRKRDIHPVSSGKLLYIEIW